MSIFTTWVASSSIASPLTILFHEFVIDCAIIKKPDVNEVASDRYKIILQSLVYLPHFVSGVVVSGICYTLLSNQDGAFNEIITSKGGEAISFLGSENWFHPIIVIQSLWKESGLGTILFLAALTSVDVGLYEASLIDGANRRQ